MSGAAEHGEHSDEAGALAAAVDGFTPVTLDGGRAGVIGSDGRIVRIGWPELGGPMFYPTQAGEIVEGRLQVSHDMGEAGVVVEAVDLRFDWSLDASVTAVMPYVMYGQSLAMNLGHDTSLTAGPVAPGRALMYANAGAGAQMSVSERPGFETHDFGPCHFPASDLDRLEDLCEQRGESPVSGAVAGFLAALPEETGVVASNHARGGMAMRKLLPKRLAAGRGTGIQYAGLLRAMIRTRQFCDAQGRELRQPVVSFIHGEAGHPEDDLLYGAELVALQAALTEDLGRITGLDGVVPMFTDQARVVWGAAPPLGQVEPPVAVAQLRAAQAHPGRIFCVGPKYFLPRRSTRKGRGDPVHLLAEASALWGDYHGRAIRQTLQGQPWVPLHVASYAREGAVIRLRVEGGDGSPLMIDRETVTETRASVLGFRWVQEGGVGRAVGEVAVAGREIIVTLTGDPGPDFARAALTIGFFADMPLIDEGPLTGGRTNIRDSSPDIGRYGLPMWNWLCHDWFWEKGTG